MGDVAGPERRGRPGRGALCVRESDAAFPEPFYARPAEVVARDLLGAVLLSSVDGVVTAGTIVETEAYVGPEDDASHAAARIGRTLRNEAMFGAPGTAYVYRIYGIHWCLNAVTDSPGHPAAVLLRAAAPITGLETARRRRGPVADAQLMRGPGNLCRALGITGELNGRSLIGGPVRILPGEPLPEQEVARGPRVGITRAVDLPLRFWVRGSAAVSRGG
ncbi:MAG: DNA-3-methyladenine glycosylase [Gemmatimonadota bacterium]